MPAMIFRVLRLLDSQNIPYFLLRTRDDGVTLIATMIGRRIEIFVDEDDQVDVSVFSGSEAVVCGLDALESTLAS